MSERADPEGPRDPGPEGLFAVQDSGPLAIGQTFLDKYEIRALLGRGGHACVYLATHRFMGHSVAIKVLYKEGGVSPDMLRRGQREAQIQTVLKHPNIVDVYDSDITKDGLLYLVMELLRGRPLRDVLLEHGRLEIDEALRIAAKVTDAMHFAHTKEFTLPNSTEVIRGVIHRDLKPDNVFLVTTDRVINEVKLIDFGIAKIVQTSQWMTQRDMVLGTVYYMSPEQVQAGRLTAQSDIYALGVMLYEMLLGQHPILMELGNKQPTFYELSNLIVGKPLPFLNEIDRRIPRDVADLVNRATAKATDQRFASMKELGEAIRKCLGQCEKEATRPIQTRDLSRRATTSSGVDRLGASRHPPGTAKSPDASAHDAAGVRDTEPVSHPVSFGEASSRPARAPFLAPTLAATPSPSGAFEPRPAEPGPPQNQPKAERPTVRDLPSPRRVAPPAAEPPAAVNVKTEPLGTVAQDPIEQRPVEHRSVEQQPVQQKAMEPPRREERVPHRADEPRVIVAEPAPAPAKLAPSASAQPKPHPASAPARASKPPDSAHAPVPAASPISIKEVAAWGVAVGLSIAAAVAVYKTWPIARSANTAPDPSALVEPVQQPPLAPQPSSNEPGADAIFSTAPEPPPAPEPAPPVTPQPAPPARTTAQKSATLAKPKPVDKVEERVRRLEQELRDGPKPQPSPAPSTNKPWVPIYE